MTKDLRKRLIDTLVETNLDAIRDEAREPYDLLVWGWEGFGNMSDQRLMDNYLDTFDDEQPFRDECGDGVTLDDFNEQVAATPEFAYHWLPKPQVEPGFDFVATLVVHTNWRAGAESLQYALERNLKQSLNATIAVTCKENQ